MRIKRSLTASPLRSVVILHMSFFVHFVHRCICIAFITYYIFLILTLGGSFFVALLRYVRLVSVFICVVLEIRLVNTVVRSWRIFIAAKFTVHSKIVPHRHRAYNLSGLVEVYGLGLHLILIIICGPEILRKPCHVTTVAWILRYVRDPVMDKFL